MRLRSEWQIPQYATLMSTSPGPRVRDRDVLEGDGPIRSVETFGKHGFCHL